MSQVKSDLKSVAAISIFTAAALVVGVNLTPKNLAVPIRSIQWTEPADSLPGDVTEIWSSTNLQSWQLKSNVPCLVKFQAVTNGAAFPELRAEYFIARTRRQIGTNAIYSPWNVKTTR